MRPKSTEEGRGIGKREGERLKKVDENVFDSKPW